MNKKIKILTTDSGLGGLAVTAELVERIKAERQFDEAEIIFFNCRPSDESGYDPLGSNEARAGVFSKALYAMYEKFRPDVIIIACNTLSVVYGMCAFAESPPVPVIGIIDDGVDQILDLLSEHPEMHMIMFGTPATVSSGMHKNILTAMGIEPERLHYQDCLSLPSVIGYGAESYEVKTMVESFMESGSAKTGGKTFGISLLCTHFGYSLPVFSEYARKFENFSGDIINPNSAIVDSFLQQYESGSVKNTKVTVKCCTHSTVNNEMRQAVFPLLEKISPDTAEAFLNITHKPDMFSI